jgi:transporter family protein
MTDNTRWIVYALLGAFFAAVVQITSKKAFKAVEIDSATVNLIRAFVMSCFFAIVIGYEVWIAKARELVGTIDRPMKIALAWVFGSGIAASLSWFYGYKALKLAGVSQTYPIDKLSVALGVILAVIFLQERPSAWNWTGIVIMVAGAYLVTIPKGSDPTWLFSGQAK